MKNVFLMSSCMLFAVSVQAMVTPGAKTETKIKDVALFDSVAHRMQPESPWFLREPLRGFDRKKWLFSG